MALPKTSLTLPTLLAGLQMPNKKIVQAIESIEQRKEVERILDEYQKTGKVVRNISLEQRKVQVVRKQKPDLRPAPKETERIAINVSPIAARLRSETDEAATPVVVPTVVPKVVPDSPDRAASESIPKSARQRLTLRSPIVDAPAIGPKTAARFNAIGCNTIDDFLSRDAQQIADSLDAKWITGRLVLQWQDQARMACQIERLTAAGSGLLIIAGIRSVEELARQNGPRLHAQLVEAAKTNEGARLLRDQEPPSLRTIERWIAAAEDTRSDYKKAV